MIALAVRNAPSRTERNPLPARVAWIALALALLTLLVGVAPGPLSALIGIGMPPEFAEGMP